MSTVDPLSAQAFQQAYDFQENPEKGDRTLNVRFFYEELKDEAASVNEARPVFKSVEMCEIRYGDKDNVVCDRVKYMKPDPRQRFPVQYARFKAGEATQVVGTLLRQWGLIASTDAKSYEAIGILTVEQLAALSDQNAQQVRGAIADRQKARDFLAMAQGQAPLSQARAEIEALKERLAALEQKSPAEVQTPEVKVRKKPGPKPKVHPPEEHQE